MRGGWVDPPSTECFVCRREIDGAPYWIAVPRMMSKRIWITREDGRRETRTASVLPPDLAGHKVREIGFRCCPGCLPSWARGESMVIDYVTRDTLWDLRPRSSVDVRRDPYVGVDLFG